jgi:F-type H+-transporting ATPase subunit b
MHKAKSWGIAPLFFGLVCACCFFFLIEGTTVVAEAAEGGDRTGDLLDLLWRFINFALMVLILVWALRKVGIKEKLSARTKEIHQRLDDLKNEKEAAHQRYQEVEEKLNALEMERKSIIDQYKQDGVAEKERIIQEAKDKVEQILNQAELTIEQEIHTARERLKEEVVDFAAKKAQEIIAKELTEQDQDRLIHDFIERVDKIH